MHGWWDDLLRACHFVSGAAGCMWLQESVTGTVQGKWHRSPRVTLPALAQRRLRPQQCPSCEHTRGNGRSRL